MAYRLTLLNPHMRWYDTNNQSIIIRNERDYDRICEAPVILDGYAQMQRVLHNDYDGDDSFSYDATMPRELVDNDEIAFIINRKSLNGDNLLTYNGIHIKVCDANDNVEYKLTNKSNDNKHLRIPAPKSVEVTVLADLVSTLSDEIEYDELDDYVDASDECLIQASYAYLEEDDEYEVLEIDKSFEKDIANLKNDLKEYFKDQLEFNLYQKVNEVAEAIKNLKTIGDFDSVKTNTIASSSGDYYEVQLAKSLDYGFEFTFTLRVEKSELNKHEILKDLQDTAFENVIKEFKINLSTLEFLIEDEESYQNQLRSLQNTVDEDIDENLRKIYDNDALAANIGFAFEPNQHNEDWSSDQFISEVLIEKVED